MINSVEILTVNYNTPDLIDNLIKSVRDVEGDYQIRVIDGSDREPFRTEIRDICSKYENIILEQQGWNIHHARGLDLGITTSVKDWVILMDSDKVILQPFFNKMFQCAIENNKMIVGDSCHVNNGGIAIDKDYSVAHPIKYYHASMLLFNKDYYIKLKQLGAGFNHHGAMSINMMKYLHDTGLSQIVGADIWDYMEIEKSDTIKYVGGGGRGTVNRFGYNL